jgi:hypothetical protein
MALTCPSCGNQRSFLIKTLQTHVVQIDGTRVDVAEESRPAVFEILCDECDTALDLSEVEDEVRREVLLSVGAS